MPASDDRGNERTGGGGGDEEEGSKGGGWITTYADMVTLLLTFFVLMLALSSTDTAKMELFMIALSSGGLTPEQFMEIQEKYDNLDEIDYDSWDEDMPNPGVGGGEITIDPAGAAALQALNEALTEYIEEEDLGEVITLTFNGEMLLMTLPGDVLFALGSAELTDDMRASAEAIADMFASTYAPGDPFEIVVSGHTDDNPINTAQYPSNWHLSSARATNFLDILVSQSQLDPAIFYSRACGEFRPIASNSTPEGQQLNRRVEVMVSLARDNPRWHQNDSSSFDSNNTTSPE